MSKPVVVILGTLDTKGLEYGFVRDLLLGQGVEVLVIDCGVLGSPLIEPEISGDDVAAAAGTTLEALRSQGDRAAAIEAMATGAGRVLGDLHREGRLHGVIGLGGSGGSSLFSRAVRSLPIGVPKLLVSTVAAGDTRAYVGSTDLTMMYSVVDIAGINRFSEQILANAGGAIAGMARAAAGFEAKRSKPLLAATMFGVTTPGVTVARERLEELGYEVLVFHATGTGGDTMESLIASGFITGVLDLTTTELADELAGGVLASGPRRLEIAGEMGVPQVVSLGALDMVNFGPFDTVPSRYAGRRFHKHNEAVTLMRTTAEECAELGRRIARKLNAARGPVTLFVPLRGVSSISVAGQPFHDLVADEALFSALRENLSPEIDARYVDADINDRDLAREMAETLHAHYERWLLTHNAKSATIP
jgi:uncharacterized protein (UPF0261 family)